LDFHLRAPVSGLQGGDKDWEGQDPSDFCGVLKRIVHSEAVRPHLQTAYHGWRLTGDIRLVWVTLRRARRHTQPCLRQAWGWAVVIASWEVSQPGD
jgi:hypothetical protein